MIANSNFDKINDATSFANGQTFTSEQEVRDYFTLGNMMDMFPGEQEYPTEEALNKWASAVIANKWHCEF